MTLMLRFLALRRLAISGIAVLQGLLPTVGMAADAKAMSYGRHLSQECSSCHRIDGVDNGIPSIVAWDRETFIATMKFYQDGQRPNPAMVSVAQSLDEAQVNALALYYGSLPKPARRAATPTPSAPKK